MEINGQSPWRIPTSSIIIPALVPAHSNYILKMPSYPQPPTPQDQSIILIFGCPPNPTSIRNRPLHWLLLYSVCSRVDLSPKKTKCCRIKVDRELITHLVYAFSRMPHFVRFVACPFSFSLLCLLCLSSLALSQSGAWGLLFSHSTFMPHN